MALEQGEGDPLAFQMLLDHTTANSKVLILICLQGSGLAPRDWT